MSKKFLSDVLIECGLQVDGTTTLGTATATTVATSDNSTNIATTAWVKSLGYSTTDSYVSSVALNGNSLDFTGINSAFTGSIDLSGITSSFNPSDVETVYERVKNTSGSIVYKGTPLAVVPGQTSGNISDVVPADASDPNKMPAVFIANEDIADEAEGEAVLFGRFSGVDTSLYQSGTTVYVAVGGGWTATKPVWPNLIQNLGVITKQHATNGGGVVTGVGRANALPNLTAGKIWVGSANYPIESTTVHVDEANARVGIGTTSPDTNLEVVGNVHISGGGSNRLDLDSNVRISGQYYTNGGTEYTYLNMYNGSDASINIGTKHSLGYISFESGNGAYTERMRITNSGNVGIGTATPTTKLNVPDGEISTEVFSFSAINGITPYNTVYIAAPRNGNLGLFTASTERITIDASGNVGIGTSNPAQKLDINGNAIVRTRLSIGGDMDSVASSNDMISMWGSALGSRIKFGTNGTFYGTILSNSSDMSFEQTSGGFIFSRSTAVSMRITNGGNVGIGTTTPNHKVDIYSNENVPLRIHRPSNASLDSAGAWGIGFSTRGDANNSTTDTRAGIFSYYNGNLFLAAANTSIVADPDAYARLTVLNTGNVGIGTTSPAEKFEIQDSAASNLVAKISQTNASYQGWWQATSQDGKYINVGVSNNADNYSYVNTSKGTLRFLMNSSVKMTLNSSGNVGIGTTSPANKLQVFNGNMSITTGYSFILSDTDTNWRLGRNIISPVESEYLSSHTFEFVAANATGQGWQFINDDGYPVLEIGAVTDSRNVWINAGNLLVPAGKIGIGITNPEEKLHVVGKVKIDSGTTSATLETTDKAASPTGAIYATYPIASTYGAFVDYVIYDGGRDSMRAGTMRATWNANEVAYSDVSTVDIGDTSVVTMTAVLNGTDVDLVVTGDAVFTVKLNVKVIR